MRKYTVFKIDFTFNKTKQTFESRLNIFNTVKKNMQFQ